MKNIGKRANGQRDGDQIKDNEIDENKNTKKQYDSESPQNDKKLFGGISQDALIAKRTRSTKTDFRPLYLGHRELLQSAKFGVDIDQMISLRRKIHQHPEGGFMEFKTQKLLKETLLGFGIPEDIIKVCAKTGLTVDIHGLGSKIEG